MWNLPVFNVSNRLKFLKSIVWATLQDGQNTSVGWRQPAGYQFATSGLNSFQKVTGITTAFAVARILAYMCYFSSDFFPLYRFCNSMGEIPHRYTATKQEELDINKNIETKKDNSQINFPFVPSEHFPEGENILIVHSLSRSICIWSR